MNAAATSSDTAMAAHALNRIEQRWNQAASPLSPRSIAALYTDEALFFGGLPDHFVGRAEVERYFRHYVGMLTSIRLAFRDQHFTPMRDAILAQGFVDFDFGLPDGRTTHASLRATLVLVHDGDDWKIMLHHFSPPPEISPVPL